MIKVPFIENLTVVKMREFGSRFEQVKAFLPDEQDSLELPRWWLANIFNTVIGEPFKEWVDEQYEAHNAQVRATVPPGRLLVFNVKEGWAPLCAFLGKEVPSESFPFVNETADLQFARKVMTVLSYAWLPMVAATATAAVRIGLTRWRR